MGKWNKIKSRRLANFSKSPNRSPHNSVDLEKLKTAQEYQIAEFGENIAVIPDFGNVYIPAIKNDETKNYFEQLRRLGAMGI